MVIKIEGKFLSQSVYTDGLTAPNVPQFVFFYKSNLHAIVGLENAFNNSQASLVQYDISGNIQKNLTFPNSCSKDKCYMTVILIGIVDHNLYVLLFDNTNPTMRPLTCPIYNVNLNSYTIINTNILPGSDDLCNAGQSAFLPFNSTHCFWNGATFSFTDMTAFSYSSLDLTSDTLPFASVSNIGGSSAALAARNEIIFIQEGYLTEYLRVNVLNEYYPLYCNYYATNLPVYLGNNSTDLVIAAYEDNKIGLKLVNTSSSLEYCLYSEIYLLDFELGIGTALADYSNVILLGISYGYIHDNITFIQVSVDPKGIEDKDIFKVYDSITTSQFYFTYQVGYSILSWALDPDDQVFAVIVQSVNDDYSILLIQYDNSENYSDIHYF